MRIGIVSDTHGSFVNAQAAARMLESLEVELVLHCGDIGSTLIPAIFARWPTHYVAGNVDEDWDALADAVAENNGVWHGGYGELTLHRRTIALLHGDDEDRLASAIVDANIDLVCHGHTHVARNERSSNGKTLILNPGALHRTPRHSIAMVDLETMTAHVTAIR